MIIFSYLITILLFSVFAFCSCKTCIEEKLHQCFDKSFLSSIRSAATKSEIYAELQNCYRDSQFECGDVYIKDGKEDEYCYLDDLGNEQCTGSQQKYDAQPCMDEYMGYMAGCAVESMKNCAKVFQEIFQENERNTEMVISLANEDFLACGIGLVSIKCILERAEEKCGKAGRDFAMGEFQKDSNDLIDACKKADPTKLYLLEMLLLHMQQEKNLESLKE